MARTWGLRFVRLLLSVSLVQLAGGATLGAQTWVPPAGQGSVSVTYQNYYVTGHFDPAGRPNKNGGTHTKAVVTELDYAVTDTIGLSVSLPFIASKYTGSSSYIVRGFETFPGPLDDGSYHTAVQDLRVEARRMFVAGPLAVAPFVGALFPTHDYETAGEAVPGRHRRELQLGASVSALLDPVVPGAYVHARYSYGAAERVRNFPYTRVELRQRRRRTVGLVDPRGRCLCALGRCRGGRQWRACVAHTRHRHELELRWRPRRAGRGREVVATARVSVLTLLNCSR